MVQIIQGKDATLAGLIEQFGLQIADDFSLISPYSPISNS